MSDATSNGKSKRTGRILLLLSSLSVLVSVLVFATETAKTLEAGEILSGFFYSLMAWAYGLGLCALVFWMHYHAARLTYIYYIIDESRPSNVLRGVLTMFSAHLAEMTVLGAGLYAGSRALDFGSVTDGDSEMVDFMNAAYTAYTSLGLGGIEPTEWMRLLLSLIGLTGLICIGWTCSLFIAKMGKHLTPRDE